MGSDGLWVAPRCVISHNGIDMGHHGPQDCAKAGLQSVWKRTPAICVKTGVKTVWKKTPTRLKSGANRGVKTGVETGVKTGWKLRGKKRAGNACDSCPGKRTELAFWGRSFFWQSSKYWPNLAWKLVSKLVLNHSHQLWAQLEPSRFFNDLVLAPLGVRQGCSLEMSARVGSKFQRAKLGYLGTIFHFPL